MSDSLHSPSLQAASVKGVLLLTLAAAGLHASCSQCWPPKLSGEEQGNSRLSPSPALCHCEAGNPAGHYPGSLIRWGSHCCRGRCLFWPESDAFEVGQWPVSCCSGPQHRCAANPSTLYVLAAAAQARLMVLGVG